MEVHAPVVIASRRPGQGFCSSQLCPSVTAEAQTLIAVTAGLRSDSALQIRANGARPALVGKNLISLKDQDGKYLIQEMLAIANGPGRGWLTYKWPSPVTNKIEDRGAYIEKMDEYFVGVGYDR